MNWAIRGDKEPDKNKQLHILSVKEYEELSEKIAKYKRAFEILKEKFNLYLITGKCELGFDLDEYEERENDLGFTIEMCYNLTNEEYELIEELMGYEEDKQII